MPAEPRLRLTPDSRYTELTEDGWTLLNKARPTHDEVLDATLSEAERTPELAPLVAV